MDDAEHYSEQDPSPKKETSPRHFKRLGREYAMQYLYYCDIASEGASDMAESLENFWFQAEESGDFPDARTFRKAKNYADKLISGVSSCEKELDAKIESFSKTWDLERMPVVDRNIIRVAIYELLHCPDIPAPVSIDEAIEISKEFSSEKSGVFINGILNGIKNDLPPDAKKLPEKP